MDLTQPVRTATWTPPIEQTDSDDRRSLADAAAFQQYQPDPGLTSMMACTIDGGVRCVFVGVKTRDDQPLLNTLGTRFTLTGVEGGENYTTLYLAHLDDPALQQRIIVWPPKTATLSDFSESAPADEIEARLRLLDAEARSERHDATPASDYGASMDRARSAQAESLCHQDLDSGPSTPPAENPRVREVVRDPRDEDAEEPFAELEERISPFAQRGEWLEARLIRGDGVALMDLFECGWHSSGRLDGEPPSAFAPQAHFELRWPTFVRNEDWLLERKRLGLRIDEHSLAHIECSKGWVEARPAKFVEWHLRALAIHQDAAAMLKAISVGPLGPAGPALRLELGKAYTLELWPAPHRVEECMLQPRVLDQDGHALLDARGSGWGVRLEWIAPWHEPIGPGMFALGLIPTYPHSEDRFAMAACELIVSMHERRVWRAPLDSEAYASGFVGLGEFHKLLHDCKGVGMLREWMDDRLARSVMIPR